MRTVMQTAGWEKSETNIEKLNILTNNIQNGKEETSGYGLSIAVENYWMSGKFWLVIELATLRLLFGALRAMPSQVQANRRA